MFEEKWSSSTRSSLHLNLFTGSNIFRFVTVAFLLLNCSLDLVENVSSYEATKEWSSKVAKCILKCPVSLVYVVTIKESHILPNNLSECNCRVVDASWYFLKTSVETNPAYNNAHNHGEGITAAWHFILAC